MTLIDYTLDKRSMIFFQYGRYTWEGYYIYSKRKMVENKNLKRRKSSTQSTEFSTNNIKHHHHHPSPLSF